MVKSGLDPDIITKGDVPRVSHYRLAAHLATAFAIYLLLLRTGFSALNPRLFDGMQAANRPLVGRLKSKVSGSLHLIGTTAISGAFVAGLDAGLIYNTFPKMGANWIPDDLIVIKPGWKNFLENPTAVQFCHRVLAIGSLASIASVYVFARFRVPLAKHSKHLRVAVNLFLLAGLSQVALGISTLIYMVPVPLAALHQAGSLALLSTGSWLLYIVKRI